MGEEFYPPPQNEPLKSPPRLGLSRSLTIYDVCQSTVVYFANNCSFFAFIYGYLSKRKQKKSCDTILEVKIIIDEKWSSNQPGST